jgi:hypothetical protein
MRVAKLLKKFCAFYKARPSIAGSGPGERKKLTSHTSRVEKLTHLEGDLDLV